MFYRGLFLAIFAICLGACSTVSSRYGNRAIDQNGLAYYLPKGMIEVSVQKTDQNFSVVIAGPVMVPDTAYRLHADPRHGALSDDNIVIKIDPETMLLTDATISSTGRATEIFENLAKSIASLQSGNQQVTETIFSRLYEPHELGQAGTDASAAVSAYYARRCGRYGDLSQKSFVSALKRVSIDPKSDDAKPHLEALGECRNLRLLGIDQPGLISISAYSVSASAPSNLDLAKCRKGLCYRPLIPVKISSRIAQTYENEDIFMVPDLATVSYFDVPSGVFAKQEYTLKFDRGVLFDVDQKTQSELVGLSLLPVKILKAVISAPVDVLTEKKNVLTAEKEYLDAVKQRADQIATTKQVCETSPASCPDTAYRIMQVELGEPGSKAPGSSRGQNGDPNPASDNVPGGADQGADDDELPTGD